MYKNEQDVEECIADTFVSIWKYRHRIEPDRRTLKGLIICTSRNIALNRYNKLKKKSTISLMDIDLASDIDIISQIENKIDAQVLFSLISKMSYPDREIFIRRHYLLQSYKEISEAMGVDVTQVRNRLYQCKLRLKKQISEEVYFHGKV